MTRPIPLAALRAIALHAQSLTAPNGSEPAPTLDAISDTVDKLVCVQIDTLHMVARAQYLTLWSRLGSYDMADFDRLIYDPADRRLFEYWGHAASIMPLRDYRYYQSLLFNRASWQRWHSKPENSKLTAQVLARIRDGQGMRHEDFERDGQKRGAWWDWTPVKTALEYLFFSRQLMIANRIHFHRVYDLPERVVPKGAATQKVGDEASRRYFLGRSLQALGVGTPQDIAHYAYRSHTRPTISALTQAGVFVPITGEIGGKEVDLLIHRDNLPLIDQALDGAIRPARTTFLNPFDSLVWAKHRVTSFWNFEVRLEAYTPEPQRRWGYYSLYILHKDRLVGRFDPKLERKTGRLILRAVHLEAGVQPDDELIADMAAPMRDFMKFHAARELVIEKSAFAAFAKKLLKAL